MLGPGPPNAAPQTNGEPSSRCRSAHLRKWGNLGRRKICSKVDRPISFLQSLTNNFFFSSSGPGATRPCLGPFAVLRCFGEHGLIRNIGPTGTASSVTSTPPPSASTTSLADLLPCALFSILIVTARGIVQVKRQKIAVVAVRIFGRIFTHNGAQAG